MNSDIMKAIRATYIWAICALVVVIAEAIEVASRKANILVHTSTLRRFEAGLVAILAMATLAYLIQEIRKLNRVWSQLNAGSN